jgi:hypothetical protein
MKKLVYTLFFTATILSFRAQTWCPPGATWYFDLPRSIGKYNGYIEFRYVGDTLINGLVSKKINGEFTGTEINLSPFTTTVISNFQNYYTYFANHVLFVYNGVNFDTVVNYKASIGDAWCYYRQPALLNPSALKSKYLKVMVSDTGRINFNGIPLKFIKTKMIVKNLIASPAKNDTVRFTHIERIGNLGGGDWYSDLFSFHPDSIIESFDGGFANFTCYKDNAFPLYTEPGATCKRAVGLTELEKSQTTWEVFPNPVHSTLLIQSEKETDGKTYELRILDILGKTQKSLNWDGKEEILLSDLQPGLYQLEIKYKGLRESIETFIKE